MSFADEMRREKGSALSEKECIEKANKEAKMYRENDIIDVSNILIQRIKDGFHASTPYDEFKQTFWGKSKSTGKKILRSKLGIDEVRMKFNGRIRYECMDCDEYDRYVIYADKEAIKEIEDNVKNWLYDNDIHIEDYKTFGEKGFLYSLKIYL